MTGSQGRFPLNLGALTALVAVCLVDGLFFGRHLLYPDLNLTYPFPGGDGPEWISDGLALAGAPVRYSARPPLVPLILAGLDRLGSLPLFPLVNQLALHLGVVALFLLLRRRYPERVCLAAALVALFDASFQLLALDVMADVVAAVFLFGAVAAFLTAGDRPGRYAAAGLLAGLSALAQQTALLFPLPAALALVVHRRRHLRDRRFALPLVAGASLFALPPAVWFVAKRLAFGTFGDVGVRHWTLLGFHFDGVGFYAAAALSLFGPPALALAAYGAWSLLRREPEWGLFVASLAATVGAFFTFAYQPRAERFLLYLFLPAGILIAEGLARLNRSWAFWPAAIVALWGAAWPQPGGGAADTRFTLWPLPAVYGELRPVAASAGTAGDLRPALRTATLDEVWAASAYGRVLAAWHRRGGYEAIDPRPFTGAGTVVYLGDERREAEDRGRTAYRLGNALRRRVKVVPRSLYPVDWWGFEDLRFVALREEFALFRLGPPGAGDDAIASLGDAVVALARDDPRAEELRRGPTGGGPPPGGAELARALARARGLERWVEGPDGFLVAFGGRGESAEWLRLLPFAVGTSGLFVVPAGAGTDLRAALAAGPVLARGEVEGLAVWRTVHLGRRVVVAEVDRINRRGGPPPDRPGPLSAPAPRRPPPRSPAAGPAPTGRPPGRSG